MPRHLTRGIVLLAALAIAVAALVVAWGDAPAVLSALGRFPPLLIVPVVLLTVWNYTLRWLRWNYYLRVLGVHGVSKVESALVFFSGFAMGLTPGKSGEVTKSYWLREIVGADKAPLARTAPIVFAERLVDGIAMLLLAGPIVHAVLNVFEQKTRTNRVAVILKTVYDSARELLTWPRLALAVGIGIVSWAGECLALYVILLGLGAKPSLELLNQATFALAAGSLVGSASLLPGGIGAAEGTVAAVLDLVAGQPRDIAAAATLLIRVCTLWFGVALGAASLLALARRLGRSA